jgi:hypothetical protein
MGEIILRTTAIKIVNKGGGTMRKLVPVEGDGSKMQVMEKTDRGSDYIVFLCPHPQCGHRNKQSLYESEAYHDPGNDRIPFRCRMCRQLIEVTRPYVAKRIIMPDEPAIRRPSVNRSILGGT